MLNIRLLEESDAPEFLRLRLEGLQNDPVAFGSSWEEERTHTPESIGPRLRAVSDGNCVVGSRHGATGRLGDIEFAEQRFELFAVFGDIDAFVR